MECLHSESVIYRDLKPENIILDKEGYIKLTDFGLSKKETKNTYTFCGTPEYLAPEIIKGIGHNKAVDWWSLGTLMFEMIAGRPPFYSKSRIELFSLITDKPVKLHKDFSSEASSFIQWLLDRSQKSRLGASERDAEEIKEHPFFRDMDWEKLRKKEIPSPFVPLIEGEDAV